MSEQKFSSNKWLCILVAFLIVISVAQTILLIQQHNRQNQIERKQTAGSQQFHSPDKTVGRVSRPTSHQTYFYPQGLFAEDPGEQFDTMSRQISSLMRHAFTFGSPLMQNLDQQGFAYTPAIDLEETAGAYIVKSDLPGLQKDKINITVKDNMLTIEGARETTSEKKDSKTGFYAQERSYGSFARNLVLPGPVDESKAKAEYANGVLMITLPKTETAETSQKVSVQ